MLNNFITNKLPDFGANTRELSEQEKDELRALLQRDFFISPLDKIEDFDNSNGSGSNQKPPPIPDKFTRIQRKPPPLNIDNLL